MIFGTTRFRLLAAMVSTTMVTISGAYGFSSAVRFGPAGRLAGGFKSGTETYPGGLYTTTQSSLR